MATTETKYQTHFYSAEKNTNIKLNFYITVLKMPTKYQQKKVWEEILNTDLALVFFWYTKILVTD